MSDVEAIGKSSVIMNIKKLKYQWKIPEFSSYAKKIWNGSATYYKSDKFIFADSTWCLLILPNHRGGVKYLAVSLRKVAGASPVTADINIGIMTVNHIILNEKKAVRVTNDEIPEWICPTFMAENKLQARKFELLPLDTLTIICSLQIKTPIFQERYRQVSEDLKKLLSSEENSDVVLNVREKTFLAHKIILGARSPVLRAMFQNNMEEKETVNVPDCDAAAFKVFLAFLYTGSANFNVCNICELYKIAEKYDVQELKLICTDFLTKNLCIGNFCDTLVLCEQFSDVRLQSAVQRYFKENFEKVISSEDWEYLLDVNFRPANNLLKQMAPSIKMV